LVPKLTAQFEAAVSDRALRIDAVRQVLRDHGKPGRGGPLTWKIFRDLVRKAGGQKCTDKTIQRDVKALGK
jgi:hypothetical protein